MNAYAPRRCGAHWLDGDCPREILAIIDLGPNEADRYDVFYADYDVVVYNNRPQYWLTFVNISKAGATYHGEMQAHEVAAYRYRMKHRYAKWSTLPDAVKKAVRRDIASDAEYARQYADEVDA